MTLLSIANLSVSFGHGADEIPAVRGLSLDIERGEIVGLVGESGSGKSVTGLAVIGLLPRVAARVTGQVLLDGQDLLGLSANELRAIRGSRVAMIFQEPMTALDPVFSIGDQIASTLRAHKPMRSKEARTKAIEMLEAVGMSDPVRRFENYPHQLSGGMRQRVMIAMALICEPELLIADEPTTALDVTIESQILDLIKKLNVSTEVAVLLISHDLGVVARTCDRVVTMYAGEIVESADVDDVLVRPRHPYSSGLIRSLPRLDNREQRLYEIPGRVPSLDALPRGCRFHPRCEYALSKCVSDEQMLVTNDDGGVVRCWRADDLMLPGVLS